MKGKNLSWLKSYFENRQQYLNYDNDVTDLAQIKCDVAQGSILGPLLFLIYVNDLCNTSNTLNPILFADDTNLFFLIKILTHFLKYLMKNQNNWGLAQGKQIIPKYQKTKYTLFHKKSSKDDLPLKLPALKTADNKE